MPNLCKTHKSVFFQKIFPQSVESVENSVENSVKPLQSLDFLGSFPQKFSTLSTKSGLKNFFCFFSFSTFYPLDNRFYQFFAVFPSS